MAMSNHQSNGYSVEVVSTELRGDGTLVIIKRTRTIGIKSWNPPELYADTVWKEVYGVKDGKIVLLREVNGIHRPRQWELKPDEIHFHDEVTKNV
jgi:hypothetical protein